MPELNSSEDLSVPHAVSNHGTHFKQGYFHMRSKHFNMMRPIKAFHGFAYVQLYLKDHWAIYDILQEEIRLVEHRPYMLQTSTKQT